MSVLGLVAMRNNEQKGHTKENDHTRRIDKRKIRVRKIVTYHTEWEKSRFKLKRAP
jgi:hypothetical protein